jgi:hypothetical protein
MTTRKHRKYRLKKTLLNRRKQRKQSKQSKQSKKHKQRGGAGGFFDFIPSPINDITRNTLTGIDNFIKTLYGTQTQTQSPLPQHQPYMQV